MAQVKFAYGTKARYDALAPKDMDTLYFTTDTLQLFKGTTEYTKSTKMVSSLPAADQVQGIIYFRMTDYTMHIWNGVEFVQLNKTTVTQIPADATNDDVPTTKAVADYVNAKIAAVEGIKGKFVTDVTYNAGVLSVAKGDEPVTTTLTGVVHEPTYDAETRTIKISQHNDGKTASYYRRPISTLWTYIKGKADGVYQPKGNYAVSNHSHTKDQVGLGNVDNTADRVKSVAVANFAKGTYINQYKTVNLTDLDQNTWYPVTGTVVQSRGLRHFKCSVQLNSGSKPSWSTHSSGFTAVVDILEESSGWGTTRMLGEVLINDQFFIADENKPPVGYQQMSYGSVPVWWLRGGGTYFLAADYDCTWTIQKSKYENSGQSVAPTTTYPGVNVNRATITANLEGNAKTATMADIANSLSGLSSRSSQGWGVQTGTFIHGEGDTTGGDFAFRRDCPNAGQLSMVLDGRFYQNEGQYRVLDESDKNQFAITGHTHTKDQVGLGNVDNTADKNKSVNYATTAKTASTGLNGISSSGTNYVRFYNGTQICWMSQSSKVSSSTSITWTFQVPFKDNNYCFVYSHYRSATGRGITKTASTVTCDFSVILTECSMLAIGCWK